MWSSPNGPRDEESYGVAGLREGTTGQQAGRSSILLLVLVLSRLATKGNRIHTYCARCIQTALFCQKAAHTFSGLISFFKASYLGD